MKDGILLINKPKGWTSHDCVALCRRILNLKGKKKIGHGGTLDPNARGLLPMFIGQATRIMEYMDLEYKTYSCRARLGITTDTLDIWGEEISRRSIDDLNEEDVKTVLNSFSGIIEQTPPAFSAVRVSGKKLYEYARSGKRPEGDIPKRKVHIKGMRIDAIDMDEGIVDFTLECSRGTYVRTICNEMGVKLGCGAVMEDLVRTVIGNLTLEYSLSPDEIKKLGECDTESEIDNKIESMMISPDEPLKKFGVVIMPAKRAGYFSHGNSSRIDGIRIERKPNIAEDPCTGSIPVNARGISYTNIYRVYDEKSGEFLGTGYMDEEKGLLKADKVFVKARV